MTAAVLILAATISTPKLGEIYTMPPWMPPSVSAANTPGSPRTAGSVPGAGRVTADTYAAYAAAQEAVLERAYYINARNGGLAMHSPTNVVYGWGVGSATKAATNLVFSPSIRILARDGRKWLQTLLGYNRDLFSALNYDGWCFWTPSGSAISIGGYGVRLASTLMGAGRAFPDFEIGDKPMPGPWPNKGLTFGNCRGDLIMPNPWPDETGYFGEAGEAFVGDYIQYWSNYQAWTNAYAVTSAQSLTNLLAAAFDRQVDYRALTNGTERLLWHRLAAADQILAAVDRAYYSDFDWNFSCATTNTAHYVYRRDACEVDTSGLRLSGGSVAGDLSFGSWATQTNVLETTLSSGGDNRTIRANYWSQFGGIDGGQIFEAPFYSVDLTVADVAPYVDPVPEPSWRLPIQLWNATMTIENGTIKLQYELHITAGNTFTLTKQATFEPPPMTIAMWATARSSFLTSVVPTTTDLDIAHVPVWPSQRAFADGKIKEFELASLCHIYDNNFETNLWMCSGNTFSSLGAARSWARNNMNNQRLECLYEISRRLRINNPSRPDHIQSQVNRALSYAESHELNAQPHLVHLVDYNSQTPPTIVWEGGEIVRIDNPHIASVGLRIDITPQTDPTIATVDCGVVCETMQFYRADFQWDTLRKDD